MVQEPSAAARPLRLATAFTTSGLSEHVFEASAISWLVRVSALSALYSRFPCRLRVMETCRHFFVGRGGARGVERSFVQFEPPTFQNITADTAVRVWW